MNISTEGQKNNNNNIILSKTMFTVLWSWQSHCESSSGSFDECRMAPSGRRSKTKPDDLGCESACTGCQNLHPPSSFIIITQPGSWYSFYHSTEGRRLSRPSWLVTYRDGLPVHRRSPIRVLTGSDVVQLLWKLPRRAPGRIWLQQQNQRCQLTNSVPWISPRDGDGRWTTGDGRWTDNDNIAGWQ